MTTNTAAVSGTDCDNFKTQVATAAPGTANGQAVTGKANGNGGGDSREAMKKALSKLSFATSTSDASLEKSSSSSQLKPTVKPWQPSGKDKVTPMKALNTGSIADTPVIVTSTPTLSVTAKMNGKAPAIQPPVGSRQDQTPSKPSMSSTIFTVDSGNQGRLTTHYLKITGLPVSALTNGAMHQFADLYNINEHHVIDQKLSTLDDGTILWHLCFDDVNDAVDAEESIQYFNQGVTARICHHAEYFLAHNGQNNQEPGPHDATVLFICKVNNPEKEYKRDDVYDAIKAHAEKLGTPEIRNGNHVPAIWCVRPIISAVPNLWKFRVEFCKLSDAKRFLELGPRVPEDEPTNDGSAWEFTAVHYEPFGGSPVTPQHVQTGFQDLQEPGVYHSPTGRTALVVDNTGGMHNTTSLSKIAKVQQPVVVTANPKPRLSLAGPFATPTNYFNTDPAAERSESCPTIMSFKGQGFPPQVVVPDHIVSGIDVRTTIMLRNLPNHWTCDDLKKVLDEIAPGQYDFSYLRIDFHNNMNVGYAFVNFTSPLLIVDFAHHYVGGPWPFQHATSKRVKYAEISYATIQGIDCLVEKFRNSAIMDEVPMCRPKLWFTAGNLEGRDVHLIGKEQQFPPPNNLSKKQRSHDNASTVGLFSPANRRMANGRYMRRSNFDRGTPAQIREDSTYVHHSPANSNYVYSPLSGYYSPGQGFNHAGGYASGNGSPAYGQTRSRNPASSMRTLTNGRLGGRPRIIPAGNSTPGGSPAGLFGGWEFVNAGTPRYNAKESVGPRDAGL